MKKNITDNSGPSCNACITANFEFIESKYLSAKSYLALYPTFFTLSKAVSYYNLVSNGFNTFNA